MIIAFHNSKGGVGTTMLAAHMCELARELGLRVVAVSATTGDGLLRWYEPETPSVDFDPESSGADMDLMVIDVRSDGEPPIAPDVWVVPICERLSFENAAALSDRLRGHLIWLGNKGYAIDAVPKYLADDVEVVLAVPYSRALERATVMHRVAWNVPELARSPGARAIHASLEDILRRAHSAVGPSLEMAIERARARRQAADLLATIQRMSTEHSANAQPDTSESNAHATTPRRALTAGEVLSMAHPAPVDDLEVGLRALVEQTRAHLGHAARILDPVATALASTTAHQLVDAWLDAVHRAGHRLACGLRTAQQFADILRPGVHIADATGLCRPTVLRFAAQPGRARLGTLVRIAVASGRADLFDLRPVDSDTDDEETTMGDRRLRSVR